MTVKELMAELGKAPDQNAKVIMSIRNKEALLNCVQCFPVETVDPKGFLDFVELFSGIKDTKEG